MTMYIIVGVVVLAALWLLATYNGLITLRNRVREAWSQIDVQLKRRSSLIPNLVETVKGYAAHEQETFQKVTEARNLAMSSQNVAERQLNENNLSQVLKSLFALAENYPLLKADTGFVQLQKQLQELEDEISQSRKYYNAVVKMMNTKVEMFPSNIVASLMGFRKYPFFMAESGERENVRVQF